MNKQQQPNSWFTPSHQSEAVKSQPDQGNHQSHIKGKLRSEKQSILTTS